MLELERVDIYSPRKIFKKGRALSWALWASESEALPVDNITWGYVRILKIPHKYHKL